MFVRRRGMYVYYDEVIKTYCFSRFAHLILDVYVFPFLFSLNIFLLFLTIIK